MEILTTGIDGLVEIIPPYYSDKRGWFLELFRSSRLEPIVGDLEFPQDNLSFSEKNVLRGLHLQRAQSAQAKLVTVISGRVLDVVVDLRKGSTTFGKTYQLELDSAKKNILFVPAGFAHGFAALEESIFFYKCSKEYDPSLEAGIAWNDPDLKIDWRVTDPKISDKDKQLPTYRELLDRSFISK
jgi:dTDP-4-dehydrorhamnose 3,5-epimerase